MIFEFNVPMPKLAQLLNIADAEQTPMNERLAGNIRKEIDLSKYTYLLENFLKNKIAEHKPLEERVYSYNWNDTKKDIRLRELWVNYQAKHEFNPIHNHAGIVSFVIFGRIPYWIKDEHKVSPGVKARKNKSGVLQFIKLSNDFKEPIDTIDCFADAGWVGKGLLFLSNVNHCVYPFYSSDDYRVTFSGNFYYSDE